MQSINLNQPILIIILLHFILLLLILIRIKIHMNRKIKEKYEVGVSMTIGNREIQEDNYDFIESNNGFLAVLADGMGKNFGGKISSQIAVNTFIDLFEQFDAFDNPNYFFQKAFTLANREILKSLDDDKCGACVSSILIRNNMLFYSLVGNIKIAVFRNGDLIPVSTGHTINMLAENKYKSGKLTRESAITLLEEKRLYNYVGQDGFKNIEFFDEPINLKYGDIVALMSDGVYEFLSWKEIEDELEKNLDIQKVAFNIIEKINISQDKNKDNASILLIKIN
ncbi:PP2C family protein-serine/threonine phosphatase [[Clostridium] colinum]|uniref:PP2C family protein-serine/threonine phosphatase n=1 Tax=[Clostridium] colinum TaxID=36835 RepID=UPI0020251494|nr:protein phosphatase 2C domain-containing protein [[Clostridium] colinum]